MGKIVRFLSEESGLYPSTVREIISRAHVSYKWYKIDKRNGGRRLIAQPAREVKALQRMLYGRLKILPIHPAATAYRTGQSILHNALPHAAAGPILKFDFLDFFPSIRPADWRAYCLSRDLFDEEDISLSSKLFFVRYPNSTSLRLAVGAPSSPWLSNVLMYDFDEKISEILAKDKVTYTRYADDLTFSAKRTGYLTGVEKVLRHTIKKMKHPNLKINEKKTSFVTGKFRRVVTGLVIADDGRITIGRERKRQIRAALHQYENGELSNLEQAKLAGYISHVKSVEPAYFYQLMARSGHDLLGRLMKGLVSNDPTTDSSDEP